MTKQAFTDELSRRLREQGLIDTEIDRSLEYYREMIEDRVEDGEDEEHAVRSLGTPEEIARQILTEMPLGAFIKSKLRQQKKRHQNASALTVVMTVLAFPIWFPLLIAAFTVILSVYVTVLALIVSLFATVVALMTSSLVSIPAAGVIISETVPGAIALLGAALLVMGIGVLLIIPAKHATIGLIRLTKWFTRCLRSLFITKSTARKESV